jgi:geranylgeranyl pyrophosphate synthase
MNLTWVTLKSSKFETLISVRYSKARGKRLRPFVTYLSLTRFITSLNPVKSLAIKAFKLVFSLPYELSYLLSVIEDVKILD